MVLVGNRRDCIIGFLWGQDGIPSLIRVGKFQSLYCLFVVVLGPSNIYSHIRMGTYLWQCALMATSVGNQAVSIMT